MELNERRYWQALRELLKRAEDEEAAELAAAERMLADTKPDPDSYFSDERIAEVVRLVTEADTDVAVANAPDDVIDGVLHSTPSRFAFERHAPVAMPAAMPAAVAAPERAPAPVVSLASGRAKLRQRLAKLPRPLAAAAMILLAPQFLAALAVVTVVFAATQFLERTTFRLPFQQAVHGLVDSEASEATQLSSLSVVVTQVSESIEVLHEIAAGGAAIGSDARKALDDLGQSAADGRAFSETAFSEDLAALRERLRDSNQDMALRVAALEALLDQLKHGFAAVRAAQAMPHATQLVRNSATVYLADLLKQVAR